VKIKTHEVVAVREGKDYYTWDEQVARWTIDCRFKEVAIDYYALYLGDKKQFSGKSDDLRMPIEKGMTVFSIYEAACGD